MSKNWNKNAKYKIMFLAIGFLLFVSIFESIQLVQIATAHRNGGKMNHGHEGCMMGSMSIEEMDQNNDGICDMCGMPMSECKEMIENHGGTMGHHGMMGGYRGMGKHNMMDMNGMNCHM